MKCKVGEGVLVGNKLTLLHEMFISGMITSSTERDLQFHYASNFSPGLRLASTETGQRMRNLNPRIEREVVTWIERRVITCH
jgi:hypothetical protein